MHDVKISPSMGELSNLTFLERKPSQAAARFAGPALAFVLLTSMIILASILADLTMPAQRALSAVLVILALLLNLKRGSENIRLLLMFISVVSVTRYILWRLFFTLSITTPAEAAISILLFSAECYTVYTLVAFYFQTLDLDRSFNVKYDPDFNPSVDIFICTYNEPVDVLRRTITGAMAVDYQNKKVHLLDDGHREEMKELARELGCGYFDRPDNSHAKSGNINNALPKTNGEFLLFLDADQIPCRPILKRLISAFKDPEVAVMQTAHRSMNPGPVERNLYLDGILPNEQELFFQLVQVGNNFWNATFFCGSSALIRRKAMEEVGGMAIETVTEDCHTAMRMHARGYKSMYYPHPISIAMAPESLHGWVIQHCRWAKGVTQMLRCDNPLFMKGLSLVQRYCYFNGMMHFWFGIPRLIFFVAPASFLLFGLHPVRVSFPDYVAMAIPYLIIASSSNSYIFKNYRHSFWADVYEALLAAPYAGTVICATLDPRTGKFEVTPKGTNTSKCYLDWVTTPSLVISVLLSIGIVFGVNRLLHPSSSMEVYATCINLGWSFYNISIMVPAILCGLEHPFTKRAHPIKKQFVVDLVRNDGSVVERAKTFTISEYSCLLELDQDPSAPLRLHTDVQLVLHTPYERHPKIHLPATVKYLEYTNDKKSRVGCDFRSLDTETISALIEVIYCDDAMWHDLKEPEDSFKLAFGNLLTTPWRVIVNTRRWFYLDRLVTIADKQKNEAAIVSG